MSSAKIVRLSLIDGHFIQLTEALQLLGKTREWWETLKLCHSRYQKLRQKGFSGEVIQSNVEVLSHQDWLALTAYLASQPNQQAVQILQTYALYGFFPLHAQTQLDLK